MWQTFLEDRQLVEAQLKTALTDLSSSSQRFPWDDDLIKMTIPFVTAGKLFRGSLILGMYRALAPRRAVKNIASAVYVASSIEFYGSAILIQDDIMDRDERRRGMQTIHTQIAQKAAQSGYADAAHIGESIAICLGDTLLFLASEMILRSSFNAQVKLRVLDISHRELQLLPLAQAEDLRMAAAPMTAVSEEQILAMFAGKTGRYSVRWSLEIAAALAELDAAATQAIRTIGEGIGVLYQLRDDYLGLYGDSSVTGKSTNGDVRENKKTLYNLYLRKLPASPEQERAVAIFESHAASDLEVAEVKEILNTLGVTAAVQETITQRAAVIQKEILEAPLPAAAQQLLTTVLDFVTARQK